jgi:hypothetical protein
MVRAAVTAITIRVIVARARLHHGLADRHEGIEDRDAPDPSHKGSRNHLAMLQECRSEQHCMCSQVTSTPGYFLPLLRHRNSGRFGKAQDLGGAVCPGI